MIKVICVWLLFGALALGYPIPTKEQLQWAQWEIGGIINFGMETSAYNVSDWGFCSGKTGENGTYWLPEPTFFNPMFLDTDQWAQAAVSFGAKYLVLSAKHCSGFTLYPTQVKGYKYSIQHSGYKDGKGDIIAEFVASCQKYGLGVGIYYSIGDNYYCNILNIKHANQTLLPGQLNITVKEYEQIVIEQVTELWSNYGEFAEIWFDGGTWNYSDALLAVLMKYQPQAVAFQGPNGFPNNIRWVGTEWADPPYPCWSTANNSLDWGGGSILPNSIWAPAESDTSLINNDYWFWSDYYYEYGIKNVSTLFSEYESAVGSNTNFLLGLNPDPFGMIPAEDMIEYKELGSAITRCYSKSIVEASANMTVSISLTFPRTDTVFNRVVISEDQTYGQRIRAYQVESFIGDDYRLIANGTSVGNKRIEVFDTQLRSDGLRLNISEYTDVPSIAKFAAYFC